MNDAPRKTQIVVAAAGLFAFVLAWWWAARDLPSYVLPGPVETFAAIFRLITEPQLLGHVFISLARVCLSVVIAMLIALALAVLTVRFSVLEGIIEHRIFVVLNSFPSVGWAVLGVIWFQISTFTVLFVQVAIVLPFCIVNALAGLRQIDPDLSELGRSLTRRPARRFVLLTLPLILPFLLAGLRIAYGLCWKIALVAELFGVRSGLGYLLMQAQQAANAAMMFGTCLVIVLMYALTDGLLLRPLVRRFSSNQRQTSTEKPGPS